MAVRDAVVEDMRRASAKAAASASAAAASAALAAAASASSVSAAREAAVPASSPRAATDAAEDEKGVGTTRPQTDVEDSSVIWCPTAFRVVDDKKVDSRLPYTDGADGGVFVAFGDLVCSDRYVMIEAHMCNRSFERAPLHLPRLLEFPHMTVARLDLGCTGRDANCTVWWSDDYSSSLDITAVLKMMNDELRRDQTVFQLHPAHFQVHWAGNRYDILGGLARQVYRKMQERLMEHCAHLGECAVGAWAQEPAHPHITFEYPDNVDVREAADDWNAEEDTFVKDEPADEAAAGPEGASDAQKSHESSTSVSTTASLEAVLGKLKESRLGRLCPIFRREGITASVLPSLTEEQLVKIGVKRLGDRQKVLRLVAGL